MSVTWPGTKDPDDRVDYELDWSARLGTDTIVSSSWDQEGGGLVIESETFTGTKTKIWVSSGEDGVVYTLVNQVTTSGGRRMDQTARLKVKTR